MKYLVALVFSALATHAFAQPRVVLTAPAPGTQYLAPVSVSLTAQSAVPATRVEFLANGASIGAATSQPYSVVWSNAPLGTHLLQARVHGTDGTVSLSPPVPIQVTDRDSGRVNTPPTVQITAPIPGTVVTAPASVTLTAAATDSDGTVTRVDFYQGGALVGSSTSAPYAVTLGNLGSGTYSFLALAFDDLSAVASSAPIGVIVNALPSVALLSPGNNATFKAPAAIPISVEVLDSDGSIASVEFFFGDTLITTRTSAPFNFTWTEVPEGSYSLTARVTDNLGGTGTSTAVLATVTPAVAKLYFIHVDHLNTPRLVADAQQRVVWRWDQQEPFGVNVPDENPSGLGAFELPLRFPGQYFDKETNLHYNYFRTYDAAIGRYLESDPIGLDGGVNTYAYVLGSPLMGVDPLGLAVTVYCRPVGTSGTGYFHCFVHVTCPSEGWDDRYSMFAGWSLRSGFKKANDSSDDPAKALSVGSVQPNFCNPDPCGYEKAVRNRFNLFPSGNVIYRLYGPNSNSFVNGLLLGNLPSGAPSPSIAPGIDIPHPGFGPR